MRDQDEPTHKVSNVPEGSLRGRGRRPRPTTNQPRKVTGVPHNPAEIQQGCRYKKGVPPDQLNLPNNSKTLNSKYHKY